MKGRLVKSVKWIFYKSDKTGKGGPSKPLKKLLEDNGIEIDTNDIGVGE